MRIDRRDFVRTGVVSLGGLVATDRQGEVEPAFAHEPGGSPQVPKSPVTVELHVLGGFGLVFKGNSLTIGTVRAHLANQGMCHYPQHGMQLELERGTTVSDTSGAPYVKGGCSIAKPCEGRWILDGLQCGLSEGGIVGGKLAYNQSPKPQLSFPSPEKEADWNDVAFIHAPADYDTTLKPHTDWLKRMHSTFTIAQGGTITVLKPQHLCIGQALWSVKQSNGTINRKPLTSAIQYSATNPDSSGHVELIFGDPKKTIKIQAADDSRVRLRLIATSYEPDVNYYKLGTPMHHLGLAYALYGSVIACNRRLVPTFESYEGNGECDFPGTPGEGCPNFRVSA